MLFCKSREERDLARESSWTLTAVRGVRVSDPDASAKDWLGNCREAPDEALFSEYQLTGDQRCFEILWDRHKERVLQMIQFGYARRDQGEAEHLTQEIFLKLSRAAFDPVQSGSFRGYLYKIVHSHCRNFHKKRARRSKTAEIISLAFDEGDAPLIHRAAGRGSFDTLEDKVLLYQALARLPARYRRILTLRIVEDLPVTEVARILGVKEGTVKAQLHRARVRMRKLLADGS